MKNKVLALLLCLSLILPLGSFSVFAASPENIVILYENDVHCAVEGYSKLSAMKKELEENYTHVGVVSGGDFAQGSSLGAISRGEYIVDLMNLVGYDAVALGNHEFDYRMERLNELVGKMDTKPICCNFQKVGEASPYFQPYSIVSYGNVDVAYIGVTTPSTLTSSSPTQFKDENGNFLYTFHLSDLYDVVQDNIDAAKADGADVIIALSHIGYADDAVYGDLDDVETLVKNTAGFDVVLDAHSHSVIEEMKLTDKSGKEVLISSTGTKFEYIGKLTISNGQVDTELLKTADYEKTDPAVDTYIQKIYNEYQALGERKVAFGDLQQLDISIVKIDKTITQNAVTETGFIILKNIIRTSQDIGFKTLCEGIETKEQEEAVIRAGCDLLQGYYYYRPMSVTTLEKLLEKNSD